MKVKLRNPDNIIELPGTMTAKEALESLDINPETVLCILDGKLITETHTVEEDQMMEIRPVISGGASNWCLQCKKEPAVIDLPRHRTRQCGECYIDFVRGQVRVAIRKYSMLRYDERILVAVSGGKDSLALWDILLDMGYNVDGLYVGLGIAGYSRRSQQLVEQFAADRGATLHVRNMQESYGFDIPDAVKVSTKLPMARSACGTCGLAKRYVFNQTALMEEYDVMATGHNLDDEASQLFGNVMRWKIDYLARQSPHLPAQPGELARKIKPLYRLTEREMAAYCVIKGLDYVIEECPLVKGNTAMHYKDILNNMEKDTPGIKAQFLYGFLDKLKPDYLESALESAKEQMTPCTICAMPTTSHKSIEEVVCAFCRTQSKMVSTLAS